MKPRFAELLTCPSCTFDWYIPKYQWKHRYPEVTRWLCEAGFSDLYVADGPICVAG
jgi:hypothetical protein